jgi:membrane protein DedA with SNARE-associated domain
VDGLLHEIVAHLIRIGPIVVFVVTMVETAAFIGLLIPAEATVLVAAFLAYRGHFEWMEILAASLLGGFLGDQLGYAFGRFGGPRIAGRARLFGRVRSRDERYASDLFRRHSALAVTIGRFLSFVRTLMPWIAGASRMPYPRFLVFDLLGVTGWAVGSVALGYLAGESWHIIAGALGTASAIVVAVGIAAAAAIAIRRRAAARAAPPASATVDTIAIARPADPPAALQ